MMPWECIDCTNKHELSKMKAEAKLFIDANVWGSESRCGVVNDRAFFSPDGLQELVDELIEDMFNK